MKIFRITVPLALFLAASCATDLGGRIDQYANVPIPSPVTVTDVRPISGGAVIKVSIPDDPYLKGVVAVYERAGVEVNTKISRYVDSLFVEGYADTQEHTVNVYSFNVNEELSEAVPVRFTPLPPAIMTVKASIAESFGGVKVHVENNTSRSDLAICILKDDDLSDYGKKLSDMKWTEVTTLFTASEDIFLSRRGLEPKEAIFGLYLRDHWGNVSDTLTSILTPIVESKLDTVKVNGKLHYVFKNANLEDDNCHSANTGYYPIEALWDGSGLSSIPHFFVSEEDGPSPTWLTIDLGNKARLSRITTLPRIGYVIYGGGAVRDYEFWGSMAPTGKEGTVTDENPYGFDDSWFCLGKFTQAKPSGYLSNGLPGDITPEDSQVYNAGNDFELDPVQYPRCNDEIRYLRVVFLNTFSTFEYGHFTKNRQVQTGEVTPFGQPIID